MKLPSTSGSATQIRPSLHQGSRCPNIPASKQSVQTDTAPVSVGRSFAVLVIARGTCDEAIQLFLFCVLNCFAELANDGERSLRKRRAVVARPLRVIARSTCDEAIRLFLFCVLNCFVEPAKDGERSIRNSVR
jgi:hypothetical protein